MHAMTISRIALKVAALALGLTFSGLSLAQSSEGGNWWDKDPWSNPERGFNWYPPDEAPKPPKKEDPKAAPKAKPKSIKQMTKVEDIREELKRLRDQAIIEPTEKNIYAYLDANQYVMDKSAMFTDMWRRVVWQNPDVDYNVRHPAATFAQNAIKDKRTQDTEVLMERLATTHGVLFFYRGDCDFCHMQAPILKMLRDRYHIEVMAVGVDGARIREFPDAKKDNGISLFVSQGRGIETVPAMYLISRDQKQVIPLGAGVLAMDEIVERIRVLYSTKPGDGY